MKAHPASGERINIRGLHAWKGFWVTTQCLERLIVGIDKKDVRALGIRRNRLSAQDEIQEEQGAAMQQFTNNPGRK
jgi:hypothetical protein